MPRKPNQRKEYAAHYNRVERYASLLDDVYKQADIEFAKLALSVNHDPNKAFKWSDYPETKRQADALLRDVHSNTQAVIINGATAEWEQSNLKNDRLARSVIGIGQFDKDDKGRDIIPKRFKPYFNNNTDALKSFIGRKQKGLGLSQKVWKLSQQYKSDLELALSVGLSDGRSAQELSRDIRQYLKEPTKLFRRIRDDKGNLQLSKTAKAYHPGAGMYRSSYKNAMRLTRTEINMAYRTADNERYKQLDFVVGFEVKRSGRGYDCSVCESLAGPYPKDFKFVGWHPHCRCYVIPILKTDDEFWASSGGESNTSSVNEVNDVPQGYKDWCAKNSARIAISKENGTLPYFLRDNSKYTDAKQTMSKPTAPRRVKTEAEKADIQSRWDNRGLDMFGDINIATELQRLSQLDFENLIFPFIIDGSLKGSIADLRVLGRIETVNKLRPLWVNPNNGEFINISRIHFQLAKTQTNITALQTEQIFINSAGGGYVRSSNSFFINQCLRTNSTQLLTKHDLRTIKDLDLVIRNNQIPVDMLLYRRVNNEWIKDKFKFDPNKFSANDITTKLNLAAKSIKDNGFTSASAILEDNLFENRCFLLEIKVKKGTPAYIADNVQESEVILQRGQPLKFMKAERLNNGDYKLHCEAW